MAWGCFSWIPCPYKKWDEANRTSMVAMLPLVGTGLGLLSAIIWGLTGALGMGPVLSGAVITGVYFVMTGFIHLDGFMDVSDAVMPRHPRREERIRILKDPHTGSFAAISMALMFLIFAASAGELSSLWHAGALALIAVATTSRCVSAMTVICCQPMPTSQYTTTDFGRPGSFRKALPALVITILVLAGCVVICLQAPQLTPLLPERPHFIVAAMACSAAWSVLGAAGVCAATAMIIGVLDRRSLGGMNGDISGHMITSGEMAGLLAAAILMEL